MACPRVAFATLLICVVVLAPRTAASQTRLTQLSLEELMELDAGRVYGASERLQPVTEAPASVSFITAEEIARFGYHTLADILRGVRGWYVTDDRNFSFLGARGFGKPGDYNSRILLLVNGHRVNDNVFGQAELGAEFGMDPALFERVEIIRGPASSLYGDSAFFGVVNVITRSGGALRGTSLTAEEGTLGTQLVRATGGHRFQNGLDLGGAATYGQSDGVHRLFFPEFASPSTNNGVADHLDGEQFTQLYGQLSTERLKLTAAYGSRRKDVPTASFGTVFNDHAHPEQTTDRHALADLQYEHPLGRGRLSFRASFDQFSYDGQYPLPPTDDGSWGLNSVLGSRWSVESRWSQPIPGRQMLTLGTEYIDNVHQDQTFRYVDTGTTLFDLRRSSGQAAVYIQDEVNWTKWLLTNGGLRYDRYATFERVTPRAAVIVMPSSTQSFKYLFGTAFRAPNEYERNTFYFGPHTDLLRPESIETHEVVWERYTQDWLRTSVSGYWYKADGLVTLVPDLSTFVQTTYVNGGHVRAKGLELEAQMRLWGGIDAAANYALQRAEDDETGDILVNSPTQLAKGRVTIPLRRSTLLVSPEVWSMSSRRTLMRAEVAPVTLVQLTLLWRIGRVFEWRGTAANLFDAQYADPGSDDHRQQVIVQNGRTLRVGLTWKYGAK